ncbi:bestrophin family ion channel [Roseisolibacter sp. H3M3-2]|uniref:bestrophin family protein n=1 Tax=Roseisolibacter sp. H3M3-2 TaxID=3031323 RepID=UPI0023DADB17|nr:bestrophin family ion channel [Roseisolibacter sp. H3M3-2]MDF1504886.1 bestrophin family ion channel [Roseisolibacter sp. H3M3-2]
MTSRTLELHGTAPRRPLPHRRRFWREAIALHGSVTPYVLPRVLVAGALAVVVCHLVTALRTYAGIDLTMEVAPHELGGAVLGILLVLRTNAGYDRWWEARKLWGGIVNQSRNLAVGALAYGPDDQGWRDRVVRWIAAFPHLARAQLRGEPAPPQAVALVGPEGARRLAAADHAPSVAVMAVARLLHAAGDRMDGFAFQQVDAERAALMDHLGGCERILKTPLPVVYSIKVRRFILLYLATLPLAILPQVDRMWMVPVVTMMLAYPLLSLDQIGVELQNPFACEHLSHLPLDDICGTIERNVLALGAVPAEADELRIAPRPRPLRVGAGG